MIVSTFGADQINVTNVSVGPNGTSMYITVRLSSHVDNINTWQQNREQQLLRGNITVSEAVESIVAQHENTEAGALWGVVPGVRVVQTPSLDPEYTPVAVMDRGARARQALVLGLTLGFIALAILFVVHKVVRHRAKAAHLRKAGETQRVEEDMKAVGDENRKAGAEKWPNRWQSFAVLRRLSRLE